MALISITNPAIKYKWVNLLWLFALALFPIILWLIPVDTFDDTGVDLCPSKLFFDLECWGCGMTRAVMYMHHFEWRTAIFYFNYGVVIVYPALVILWLIWIRKSWLRFKIQFKGA